MSAFDRLERAVWRNRERGREKEDKQDGYEEMVSRKKKGGNCSFVWGK